MLNEEYHVRFFIGGISRKKSFCFLVVEGRILKGLLV